MRKNSRRGFTLIELLIAATIFSVVALSLYSAFQTGILVSKRIEASSRVYQSARVILQRMQAELGNAVIYSGENSEFKGSTNDFSFFTTADYYSQGTQISGLSRIKYEPADTGLRRLVFRGLDALNRNAVTAEESTVYTLKNISYEYAQAALDPNAPYEWKESWPPEDSLKNSLPLAIRVKLTLLEEEVGGKAGTKPFDFEVVIPVPFAQNTSLSTTAGGTTPNG